MTEILISFCNTTPGAPSLVLADADLTEARVLRVPAEIAIGKPAGLLLSERFLFVVTSRANGGGRPSFSPPNTSRLFVFDRDDLSLRSTYTCASVLDGHSLQLIREADGETLVDVVSTGTDEIVRLTLRGADVVSEEVVWRPSGASARADTNHFNSVSSWRGQRLLSGFGEKSGGTWSSAHGGFIQVVETGELVATNIQQPHSIVDVDGALFYCQSGTGTVHRLNTDLKQLVPGYARGMTRLGPYLYVGTSRARRVSKSTGILTSRSDPGASTGWCTVSRLSIETLEIDKVLDLDYLGTEIYDVIVASGTERWPVLGETEWRDELVAGLIGVFDERDATLAWLHTQVAERDRQVAWLHQEVADRDKTVEWLHREVAERDQRIAELREQSGIRRAT